MDHRATNLPCKCHDVFQHNILECKGNTQNELWLRQLEVETRVNEKLCLRNEIIAALLLTGDARKFHKMAGLLLKHPELCKALGERDLSTFYQYVEEFADDFEIVTSVVPPQGAEGYWMPGEANLIIHILGNLSRENVHIEWFGAEHTTGTRSIIKKVRETLQSIVTGPRPELPLTDLEVDPMTEMEPQNGADTLPSIENDEGASTNDLIGIDIVESPEEMDREIGSNITGVKPDSRTDSGIDTDETDTAVAKMSEIPPPEERDAENRKDSGISETMSPARMKENDDKSEIQSTNRDEENTEGSPISSEDTILNDSPPAASGAASALFQRRFEA